MNNVKINGSIVLFLMALVPVVAGCSGGGSVNPVTPMEPGKVSNEASHSTWGLWQFTADPEAETLDLVQLRIGNFHLNVLPFLEPPPHTDLTVESVEFNGDIIDVGIGLRHPFIGLDKFTGFDVCGILITNGSVSGFSDPNLIIAGEGDTRLLNPDGFSRWWNPAEFPINTGTIFAYNDGMLGTPDSIADYNSTLNAYKYFADDLGPDDTLDMLTTENRGLFSSGQKNIRNYTLQLGGDGLIFNYAVDANWAPPTGGEPWQVPDDFPPKANRPEAYRISVSETENSLYPGGGQLGLEVWVFDWYSAGSNEVAIEAPGVINLAMATAPDYVGDGYAVYSILATDCNPTEAGDIDVLISVCSDTVNYGGLLPGEDVTAYFIYQTTVVEDIPVEYNLVLDIERNGDNLITGIELDWDDAPGISGYNIYRQDPFDDTDDWVLLPASPVTVSEYVDNDIVGNEAYQYRVVGLIGAIEVTDKSVEAYAILENAEDNVSTDCVWEHASIDMYSMLFNEFGTLAMTPNNGDYCWDEGGTYNNGPGSGGYNSAVSTVLATPVLPLPEGADICEIEFCVRLNNLQSTWTGEHCGAVVGVTNIVVDSDTNPFTPSQDYIEGLDYNWPHIDGLSKYGYYPNINTSNDMGHAVQYPSDGNIQYTYSKFALPDVFTMTDARAAFVFGCGNAAGGTGQPNVGTSFDDIAVLVY